MSSSIGKSLGFSSSLKEEVMVAKKQGIVAILRPDCETTKPASLRRTLSADMSSKKWLAQHGLSPLKKIATSEEFPRVSITTDSSSSAASEGEEEYEEHQRHTKEANLDHDHDQSRGQFDIWSSIQEEKTNKKDEEKPATFDIWSSILLQKAQEDSKNLPPPYIHPMVKRSASSLSSKSLEICTESLGSETGSDVFSSYPPSETSSDAEEDKEEEQQETAIQQEEIEEKVTQNYNMKDWGVAKYNNLAATSKRSIPRSFPPPIPSLSSRVGGSVHMRTRRDNGRLVLEAVSVPSPNNFHAQRQDGRLVLTFINSPAEEEQEAEGAKKEVNDMEFEVELENSEDEKEHEEDEEDYDDEDEIEEDETEGEEGMKEVENERGGSVGGDDEDMRFVMEQAPKLSSGVTHVHRLALMIKNHMVLANSNPTWPNKFKEIVKFEEELEGEEDIVEPITTLTQSLPPRPRVARMIPSPPAAAVAATVNAAASFNAYEYYWKPKPMGAAAATAVLTPITHKTAAIMTNNNKFILSKNIMPNEQQELLVLRGNKGDYFVPLLKGCKESRRSLLFWEPCCIATS